MLYYRSRPGLPGAAHAVLEGGELIDAPRAARVKPTGRNPDLGAEAELAAVGKLRRGVVQDNGGVHLAQEPFRAWLVLGHDRFGVVRPVTLDVRNSFVQTPDHFRG